MLVPINVLRLVQENYKKIKKDYGTLNVIVSFLVLPVVLAAAFYYNTPPENSMRVLKESINFISIVIGFLINALVLIIMSMHNQNRYYKKLKEHLSFNIINAILVGIFYTLGVLLFYGDRPILILCFYFLLFHFITLLLNILRKFGAFIEYKQKEYKT